MKVLVTGSTGLVGGNLVRVLLDAGHEVRVLVRATSDASTLRGLAVQRFTGDVLEPETLTPAMDGCDVVFHAAAVFAYWGYTRAELEDIAVRGTRHVLSAARVAGVRRLVMTSSSVVLGASAKPRARDERSHQNELNPSSYTLSKMAQEQAAFEAARELGLDLVVVCPTLTVGAHDYRLSPSNASIANYLNDPLRSTFTGGCNIVSARDVAAGHLIAAAKGAGGQRYVLGSENLHWRDVHALVSELGGTFGPSLTLNNTSTYLVAALVETSARVMGSRPAVTRDEAAMSGRFYWYSSDVMAQLGYAPAPGREALAEALAWLIHRAHLNESVVDGLDPDPRVIDYYRAFAGGRA